MCFKLNTDCVQLLEARQQKLRCLVTAHICQFHQSNSSVSHIDNEAILVSVFLALVGIDVARREGCVRRTEVGAFIRSADIGKRLV